MEEALMRVLVLVALVLVASNDDRYWRDFRKDSEYQACIEKWTEALREDCLRQLWQKYHHREENMGFLADEVRLPPDPKIGGSNLAKVPDLTVSEYKAIREIIRNFMRHAGARTQMARIMLNVTDVEFLEAYARVKPALQKFLGPAG